MAEERQRDPWVFRLFWMGLLMASIVIGLLDVRARRAEEIRREAASVRAELVANRELLVAIDDFQRRKSVLESKFSLIKEVLDRRGEDAKQAVMDAAGIVVDDGGLP